MCRFGHGEGHINAEVAGYDMCMYMYACMYICVNIYMYTHIYKTTHGQVRSQRESHQRKGGRM